jgi:hypothetical protein
VNSGVEEGLSDMEASKTRSFVTLAILLIIASQAVRNWFGSAMIVCPSVRINSSSAERISIMS